MHLLYSLFYITNNVEWKEPLQGDALSVGSARSEQRLEQILLVALSHIKQNAECRLLRATQDNSPYRRIREPWLLPKALLFYKYRGVVRTPTSRQACHEVSGFAYGRHERSELVRIARKLSKLQRSCKSETF